MLGTATWYCAKCSRFIDPSQTTCDACGRLRGSARTAPRQEDANLYWIRVAQSRRPGSAQAGAKAAPKHAN